MNEDDYKITISLLREIVSNAFDIAENFNIDKNIFTNITTKAELIEEIITSNYIGIYRR